MSNQFVHTYIGNQHMWRQALETNRCVTHMWRVIANVLRTIIVQWCIAFYWPYTTNNTASTNKYFKEYLLSQTDARESRYPNHRQ